MRHRCPICDSTSATNRAPFRCEAGHELCATCVARIVFDDGPCACCAGFKWVCPFCRRPCALERQHVVELIRAGIPAPRRQRVKGHARA